MTKDEIRKLLGGYATNTLTESERKALFEAALEDQELFNALQNEEALKDLLDDPVARAQIRQAFERHSGRVHGAGRMRWWAFGGAASAVAAAAILFVCFAVAERPAEPSCLERESIQSLWRRQRASKRQPRFRRRRSLREKRRRLRQSRNGAKFSARQSSRAATADYSVAGSSTGGPIVPRPGSWCADRGADARSYCTGERTGCANIGHSSGAALTAIRCSGSRLAARTMGSVSKWTSSQAIWCCLRVSPRSRANSGCHAWINRRMAARADVTVSANPAIRFPNLRSSRQTIAENA